MNVLAIEILRNPTKLEQLKDLGRNGSMIEFIARMFFWD